MANEKELLRITDEETGYDLVAVQNPHGDFGISTFAENEDGRKPVDGKYMLSKMIGQIGNGGCGVFEIFFNSATTTVNKTYSDIKQAYYAGKNVTLRLNGDVILHLSMIPAQDDDSADAIVFSGLADIYIDTDAAELESANVYQVAIASDESVTYEQGYFGKEHNV